MKLNEELEISRLLSQRSNLKIFISDCVLLVTTRSIPVTIAYIYCKADVNLAELVGSQN